MSTIVSRSVDSRTPNPYQEMSHSGVAAGMQTLDLPVTKLNVFSDQNELTLRARQPYFVTLDLSRHIPPGCLVLKYNKKASLKVMFS